MRRIERDPIHGFDEDVQREGEDRKLDLPEPSSNSSARGRAAGESPMLGGRRRPPAFGRTQYRRIAAMDHGLHADDWNPDDDRTLVRTAPLLARTRAEIDWCHTLVVVQGTEPGRRHVLESAPLRIGRRLPSDVVVAEPEVSGAHCEVLAVVSRDALVVTDLQSTNGTFVDGRRVDGRTALPPGGLLHVGSHVFRHEYLPRHAADAAIEIDRDLEKASRYVQSLLPKPMRAPGLHADWVFRPSTRLGGDAFGYDPLPDGRLSGYMLDVCGHGASSAMHSVSILNVLRQRALPDVDFGQPAQVLTRLNDMFPMESHGGLYFTLWYGVYEPQARSLRYGSAGHHAAYLRPPLAADTAALRPLQTRRPPIGMWAGQRFEQAEVSVAPGSRLYAFSDGAFEFVDRDGRQRALPDFLPLILEPEQPGVTEPERLWRRVTELSITPNLEDDFTAFVVTFLSQ